MRVLTIGTDKEGCREVNLLLPLYLFLSFESYHCATSICIRCITLLLQLGESVQRFFHRGLLLYPSLVPRKHPVSQAFAAAWALMHKPDQRRSTKKEKKRTGLTPPVKKKIGKKRKKRRERFLIFLLNSHKWSTKNRQGVPDDIECLFFVFFF